MTCIIVEDQPPAQRILQKYIEEMGSLELKGTFSDALKAIEFLKTHPIDLLFLDIHLPKLSGIDFLRTMSNPPSVILTTAFSEYALESYEFNVIDYLLKPFSFQRFLKAVTKVSELKKQPAPYAEHHNINTPKTEIYIKSGYEHIKISIATIQNISANSDYTEIVTSDKNYLSSEPLHFWSNTLPANQFYRIHKSHIVNTRMIAKIIGNQVTLTGGAKLPIGRAYKEGFMKAILE